MRVILEIMSGPDAGRKVLLGASQVLRVGRTEWADFSVPNDGRISGVHFALETDNVACYLRDLNSTNGTQLNDTPVTQRVALHTGDRIQAGDTIFSVNIEGETARPVARPVGPAHAAAIEAGLPPAEGAPAAPPPERRKVEFSVETCTSGLTLCRGSVEAIPPADLAVLLGRSLMVYLIVDFRKLGAPPPEELTQPEYLFDWLDPEVAAMVSPVILSQADLLTWPELVAQGWGNDAVICLFSTQEKPAVLAHLRKVVRVKGKPPDQGGAILGYCWPGVMAMLLAHNSPGFVSHLIDDMDAVLVEFPDLPDTWQLFGQEQLPESLNRFGFVEQPAPAS
jgi:hypothetical protein